MSHITKVKTQIKSLDHLETAVKALGGELHIGQKEFVTYGGQKAKCDHAITFPKATYGIGVVAENGGESYRLELDFWSTGGLKQVVGEGANKLKVEYSVAASTSQLVRKGFKVVREDHENGVRLTTR